MCIRDRGDPDFVTPLAEAPQGLFVTCAYEFYTESCPGEGGQPVEYPASRPVYALISPEDYQMCIRDSRNVGQTAEVIAAVEPARPGRARLSGVDWAARCDVPLAEGQLAEVVAVEGTTLVLRPSAGSSTRAV